MDQKQLFKQMLDFQKATFDNSFKAMTTLQEQGEQMVNTFLEQATWLPEEGKKAVTNWINAYKEGREKYREAVEKNFEKVEHYFSGTDTSAE
jgi:polyhydroxyalkanoate synthesis regulator phasin